MPQTSATTDDYWTPAWLFEALGVEFDVDVACPPEGPPHTPCKTFFTQETDGLASEWIGNVWMNPPYGKVTPWAMKFMDHAHGICLVPFTKAKWFDLNRGISNGISKMILGMICFLWLEPFE